MATAVAHQAPDGNGGGGDGIYFRGSAIAPHDRKTKIIVRVKDERRQSKPARSESIWCRYFTVYVKKTLAGIVIGRICQENGDFEDAEVRFCFPTHLVQVFNHTKRKGRTEAYNTGIGVDSTTTKIKAKRFCR